MSVGGPPASGRGLSFSVAGIPVTISLSVVLVLAFLGFQLGDPVEIALWVGIGLLSILLHELGHAVAARAAGSEPSIELAGLGGVTTYAASPRTQGRGWSLLIGLAGPAVGIVLGLAAIALGAPCCRVVPGAPPAEFALSVFVFVSLVWSVLNLLPILPLDGGQALAALLPGTPRQRHVRAATVGALVGAVVTLLAFLAGAVFGALLIGLLTWQNIRVWLDARRRRGLVERAVGGDLRAGRDALVAGEGDERTARQLQEQALHEGSWQLAAEIGEAALLRGSRDARFAYDAAVAWVQVGVADRAVRTLERAVELGHDRTALRDDPRLLPLHDHPRWPELTRVR